MFRDKLFRQLIIVAALLAGSSQPGRAQIRIPAIDPTGQHILSGATTTLAGHDWPGSGLFHKQPSVVPVGPPIIAPPSAVAPTPVQPSCTPPVEAVPIVPLVPQPVIAVPQNSFPVTAPSAPVPSAPPGPELRITPARIVAPVNTEVVLAAGICSLDGYYVTRQPLEWMLAQDGVGQIVAVGHESPHNTSYLFRNSPQKIATNYV